MTTFLGGSGQRSYWEHYASARRVLIVNVILVRGLERNVLRNPTGMPPEEPVMIPALVGVLVCILFLLSLRVGVYSGRMELLIYRLSESFPIF